MSRQIQIRRGTTTEHASFTGAIGEVTMDTDKKTIFVHDGETLGGIQLARADEIPTDTTIPETYDFVIESGGTNASWYRKYKSGWIEQGGYINNLTTSVVNVYFSKEMASADFTITLGGYINNTSGAIVYLRSAGTTTRIDLKANTGTVDRAYWKVEGWAL